MVRAKAAFSGFSVKDLAEAKQFYAEKLGLTVDDGSMNDIVLHIPGSDATVFVYQKDNHEPASYTVFNLVVDDIDAAVEELQKAGVSLEKYEGMYQDEKGIMRGRAASMGPASPGLRTRVGMCYLSFRINVL